MRLSLVVAVADNGVIGRAGGLPWHLPDDLKHFRALTIGKAVLMGRRTFEAIGHALPGRYNLILSRATLPAAEGVQVVRSLAQAAVCAQELCGAQVELCVIGGAQVYAATLSEATRIYLTQVHASVAGDVYFPGYQPGGVPGARIPGWREIERAEHGPDARHDYGMSFVTLERAHSGAAV